MPKSAFTEAQSEVVAGLAALRKERGVTQIELAARLNKRQQFVSVIESGDRRVDIVEFFAIVRALGADPVAAFDAITRRFPDQIQI